MKLLVIGESDSTLDDVPAADGGDSAHAISRVATLAEAIDRVEQLDEVPELVVLVQGWPGQYPRGEVDRLRRSAPLARLWCMQGPWCEGEPRSGSPLPAAVRSYWHEWSARWGQQKLRMDQGHTPAWAMPVTATEEERLLDSAPDGGPPRSGTIVVEAEQSESAAALGEACQKWGFDWVWIRPGQPAAKQGASPGASIVLWDAAASDFRQPEQVQKIRHRYAGVPVIALVGFPRPADVEAAERAGIFAVLAKPYRLEDLLWHIDRRAAWPNRDSQF